jgi:hypothetical protein
MGKTKNDRKRKEEKKTKNSEERNKLKQHSKENNTLGKTKEEEGRPI